MPDYRCTVVERPGTGTSPVLQPMFNAWAGVAGLRLFPGTAYLCADAPVAFPEPHISLMPFEHLHGAPHRRKQGGYSPRLYPVALGSAQLAWVYRWSHDDPGLGFVGNLGDCEAPRLLEVIAPLSIRRGIGVARVTLSFLAI